MNIISSETTRASKLRASFNHPVVDGDAHVIETGHALLDYIKQVAGGDIAEKYETMTPRWKYFDQRPIHWGMPSGAHSGDRATAMLPHLLRARMDDCGIDVAIVYTTLGLGVMHIREDDIRQAAHRALNMLSADMFRGTGDRLINSALIPMFSPAEALEELNFVTGELGYKAATFGTEIRLAIDIVAREAPDIAAYTEKINPVALDAKFDYDPVWQRCVELGIPVAAHTGARAGLDRFSSQTNYVFNHLGSFAASNNYFCRCVFLDGVTRRFPSLNFAFLEGGVGWAAQLYNDLFEHWEKRNIDTMKEFLDPAKLDMDLMIELADEYGKGVVTPEAMRAHAEEDIMGGIVTEEIELDDFKRCEITEKKDIIDLFVEPFYFGCEADDGMNAVAFQEKINHYGVQLKAFFGSDIGHWDVMDITHCVPDAYENVEKGLFSEENFEDFVFNNPVSLFTRTNPKFFDGTIIESAVKKRLA